MGCAYSHPPRSHDGGDYRAPRRKERPPHRTQRTQAGTTAAPGGPIIHKRTHNGNPYTIEQGVDGTKIHHYSKHRRMHDPRRRSNYITESDYGVQDNADYLSDLPAGAYRVR